MGTHQTFSHFRAHNRSPGKGMLFEFNRPASHSAEGWEALMAFWVGDTGALGLSHNQRNTPSRSIQRPRRHLLGSGHIPDARYLNGHWHAKRGHFYAYARGLYILSTSPHYGRHASSPKVWTRNTSTNSRHASRPTPVDAAIHPGNWVCTDGSNLKNQPGWERLWFIFPPALPFI
jgi:hypothetical protein